MCFSKSMLVLCIQHVTVVSITPKCHYFHFVFIIERLTHTNLIVLTKTSASFGTSNHLCRLTFY